MTFEVVDIIFIDSRGHVLLYKAQENDTIFEDGMISLDKKWLMPCTLGDNARIWYPIEIKKGVYKIRTTLGYREINENLLKLVDFVLFERLILSN